SCTPPRSTRRHHRSQKKPHPIPRRRAFYTRMQKNNGHISRERRAMDYALAAMEQMELYCQAHPRSPTAVRRPRLFVRGELWIALLGQAWKKESLALGQLSPPPCARLTRNTWLDCDRPLR